jgi:hypothetical protein
MLRPCGRGRSLQYPLFHLQLGSRVRLPGLPVAAQWRSCASRQRR